VFESKSVLYMMNLDDRKPRKIPGQMGKNKDPHWSYDGKWIVFSSNRDL